MGIHLEPREALKFSKFLDNYEEKLVKDKSTLARTPRNTVALRNLRASEPKGTSPFWGGNKDE
jgi:hypothetical protein